MQDDSAVLEDISLHGILPRKWDHATAGLLENLIMWQHVQDDSLGLPN